MSGPRLRFEVAEYRARCARLRGELVARGLDGAVLVAPEHLYYLTGYDAWSYYTHQTVLVTAEERDPIWIGRAMDVPCAHRTVWMASSCVVGYEDVYVDSADRHPMEVVAAQLRELGLARARIGAELETYFYTARAHAVLGSALPSVQWTDVTGLVNRLRLVKSAREIEYVREAAAIATRAMHVAVAELRPGVRRNDVAARITAALIEGTASAGGDQPSEVVVLPTGEETNCPHLGWTDEPLAAGATTNVELGGCRHRYNAALARSVSLGTPPPGLRALAGATLDALDATLAAVRPGVSCAEVEAAWRAALAPHGLVKASRIGYSIGIGYPPAWIERSASLRPGDWTVLQPGMTFHLMGGMWRATDGFVASETFLVTSTGCEVLTSFPRELVVR